ncbi:Glucan endo-1,3-beta-glucosidase [Camellia lanceoleosa]|uniref:Glucan endo-1,3-beta-glucosidase n=1 Tax=Camellia lanceoleosa TaxID=1840588 RepID=A0ACC0IAN1_9ERIC|nr:Glucan endo-1,3-beta-glucosidase [Camellia lanceoleosa]
MDKMISSYWLSFVLSIIVAFHSQIRITESSFANDTGIGVCYGMMGDSLPSLDDVVSLYKKKNGINSTRLFNPNPSALQALIGSQIHVSLGVSNQDIPSIALSQDAAKSWFATNLEPYLNDIVFSYITVGNEAIPGDYASYIASAMQNLQNILNAGNLASTTKVTTVVSTGVLATSYPPSSSAFSLEARDNLIKILGFLSAQGSPLMVNVYPYFAFAAEPANVRLDYAQFTAKGPVVLDGNLRYQNMFDAIVDACY